MPEDLVPSLQRGQGGFVGEVAAFAVSYGNLQDLAGRNAAGEGGFPVRGLQKDLLTVELQVTVADQDAGEEAGFAEDLETVANADHQATLVGELPDGLHDWTEPGDGPAAQVISVTKPTGHDHRIHRAERGVLVPDKVGVMAQHTDRMDAVLVTVGGGELKNGKIHLNLGKIRGKFRGDNPQSRGC